MLCKDGGLNEKLGVYIYIYIYIYIFIFIYFSNIYIYFNYIYIYIQTTGWKQFKLEFYVGYL